MSSAASPVLPRCAPRSPLGPSLMRQPARERRVAQGSSRASRCRGERRRSGAPREELGVADRAAGARRGRGELGPPTAILLARRPRDWQAGSVRQSAASDGTGGQLARADGKEGRASFSLLPPPFPLPARGSVTRFRQAAGRTSARAHPLLLRPAGVRNAATCSRALRCRRFSSPLLPMTAAHSPGAARRPAVPRCSRRPASRREAALRWRTALPAARSGCRGRTPAPRRPCRAPVFPRTMLRRTPRLAGASTLLARRRKETRCARSGWRHGRGSAGRAG